MFLVHLTPAGLFLDIVGFLLVFQFRRELSVFISNRAPRRDEGKDGDLWLEADISDEEAAKGEARPNLGRRLLLAGC